MGASLESVLEELVDSRAEVRRRAVPFAVEAFPAEPAVRAGVLAALADPVWCVREVAAAGVGRFPDDDGSIFAALVALTLRDPSPHVRLAAAASAGPRIDPTRDYGEAITHRFERQRIRAALALGHVAPERGAEAVQLLARCVADSHPKVRLAGLRALARLEPAAVVPILPLVVQKCGEANAGIADAVRAVCARAES